MVANGRRDLIRRLKVNILQQPRGVSWEAWRITGNNVKVTVVAHRSQDIIDVRLRKSRVHLIWAQQRLGGWLEGGPVAYEGSEINTEPWDSVTAKRGERAEIGKEIPEGTKKKTKEILIKWTREERIRGKPKKRRESRKKYKERKQESVKEGRKTLRM